MRKWNRKWNDESGQILVFAVGGVIVLAGFLALALDASLLFRSRRNLQIAADSAATTAALDYYYNSSSGATAVTQAEAVGVQAAAIDNVKVVNGTTVDVHCPVQNGVYKNSTCNGYFEAIVQQPNPTIFMGLFNHNSVTVATRAVAGTPYVSNACVYVLNSSGNIGAGGGGNGVGKGDSSVYLFGKFDVSAPNCGMVINGTASSDALNMQGGAGSLTAGSIAVVGGVAGAGDSTPTPVTGAAPVENPLQAISPPTIPASCTSGGSISNTSFVSGACYSGDNKGNLTVTNDTFNGTFIFTGTGTLTFGGNVTSGANGATIYLQNGGMSENAGTVFTGPAITSTPVPPGCASGCFAAPSSGSLQGIALMAPSTNTNLIEFNFGNSSGTIDGITYMPGATLYLHNNSGSGPGLVLDTDLVIGQIDDQAGSVTINSFSQYNPTITPLKAVALVE